MDTTLIFIVLLRCSVAPPLSRQPLSFSMVFSGGTELLVYVDEESADCDDNDLLHPHNKTAGSGPSVRILSSVPLSLDPGLPHLLVCILTGFDSPVQSVRWGVNDTMVASSDVLQRSEGGGVYSATSVWEVPAADRRSRYWCETIQEGRVHRQQLCSED